MKSHPNSNNKNKTKFRRQTATQEGIRTRGWIMVNKLAMEDKNQENIENKDINQENKDNNQDTTSPEYDPSKANPLDHLRKEGEWRIRRRRGRRDVLFYISDRFSYFIYLYIRFFCFSHFFSSWFLRVPLWYGIRIFERSYDNRKNRIQTDIRKMPFKDILVEM